MSPLVKKNLWVLELVAIALAAYLLAKMTTNLVAVTLSSPPKITVKAGVAALPKPSATPRLSAIDYKSIVERNIFDSANIQAEPDASDSTEFDPTAASAPPSNEPVETALSVELVSVFAVGEGKDMRSNATMLGKDTGQDGGILRVNESFETGTKIAQILADRVIFTHNGRLEYVLLNDFTKGSRAAKRPSREKPEGRPEKERASAKEESADGDTKFTVKRTDIESAMENLDQLFTQIRAVPYTKDGKMSGLKLLSVKGDSLFAKLGLKRGDVLEKINGKELDVQQGMALFNSLKSENKINLELIRRGKPQTLEYDVQ